MSDEPNTWMITSEKNNNEDNNYEFVKCKMSILNHNPQQQLKEDGLQAELRLRVCTIEPFTGAVQQFSLET